MMNQQERRATKSFVAAAYLLITGTFYLSLDSYNELTAEVKMANSTISALQQEIHNQQTAFNQYQDNAAHFNEKLLARLLESETKFAKIEITPLSAGDMQLIRETADLVKVR